VTAHWSLFRHLEEQSGYPDISHVRLVLAEFSDLTYGSERLLPGVESGRYYCQWTEPSECRNLSESLLETLVGQEFPGKPNNDLVLVPPAKGEESWLEQKI
jgi:hypothetical protein